MTDLERFLELMRSFGFHEDSLKVEREPRSIGNTGYLDNEVTKDVVTFDTMRGDTISEDADKLEGYGGFYCQFSFREDGSFYRIGTYE